MNVAFNMEMIPSPISENDNFFWPEYNQSTVHRKDSRQPGKDSQEQRKSNQQPGKRMINNLEEV